MKKAVIVILIVLFSNNILYVKNAKIGNKSKYRTQREYQKALIFKKQIKTETKVTNMFLISILVGTVFVSSIKNQNMV